MQRIEFRAAGLVVLCIVAVAACGGDASQDGGSDTDSLTARLSAAADSLDPSLRDIAPGIDTLPTDDFPSPPSMVDDASDDTVPWIGTLPMDHRSSPPPTSAGPDSSAGQRCDPNYTPCVPIASDVDCAGGRGNGPAYVQGPVRVIGRDIYKLDRDGDGIGCEN